MLEKNIIDKMINLFLVYQIEDSNSYIRILHNQIKFYETKIKFLNTNKPLFFQKKKLEENRKKINEYEQKIFDIYIKLEEEINLIIKIQNQINI